jgi:hypothetical protein
MHTIRRTQTALHHTGWLPPAVQARASYDTHARRGAWRP